MSRDKMYGAAILAAAVMGVMSSSAMAEAWSFGVMADTQWTSYPASGGSNGVSTQIISEVNKRFNAAGVDFVIQVGDLSESGYQTGGSANQLQTRLNANAGTATYLTAGGTQAAVTGLNSNIKFFGLRGNHEGDATSQTFFQNNFIPTNSTGYTVETAGFDNTSYAVTHNGTKIVLLDYPTSTSTTALDSAVSWMSNGSNTGVLQESGHTQAFVFQHKNLIGQNHKDNEFQTGSGNQAVQDANPTQQYNFIKTLATNGVRYDISGHDHMNHRSQVTTAGLAANQTTDYSVQQIICQSDSTKFYTASSNWDNRETSFSDQQDKIGYYTFTVDGPRVTGKYYSADKNTVGAGANGTIVDSPVWTLQDTFGYSTNGKQTTVARGGSYTGISDSIAAGSGFHGTSMRILSGTNTTTATAEGNRACADDLNTGWTSITEGANPALKSDILSIWGMANGLGSDQTDTFTLSVSYDATFDPTSFGSNFGLRTKDAAGNWVLAGTTFAGDRAWSDSDLLGTYGYNSADHTVWAVVNHNSDFVAAVPEPTALAFMGVSALILGRRRRKA